MGACGERGEEETDSGVGGGGGGEDRLWRLALVWLRRSTVRNLSDEREPHGGVCHLRVVN